MGGVFLGLCVCVCLFCRTKAAAWGGGGRGLLGRLGCEHFTPCLPRALFLGALAKKLVYLIFSQHSADSRSSLVQFCYTRTHVSTDDYAAALLGSDAQPAVRPRDKKYVCVGKTVTLHVCAPDILGVQGRVVGACQIWRRSWQTAHTKPVVAHVFGLACNVLYRAFLLFIFTPPGFLYLPVFSLSHSSARSHTPIIATGCAG